MTGLLNHWEQPFRTYVFSHIQ